MGPARLLLPAVLVLAGIYAALPVVAGAALPLLTLCVVWGLVNHSGLGILVGLLARCGADARGLVMGLYSSATYLAAAIATATLGPVYEGAGYAAVAAAAASVLVVAAVPARRVRRHDAVRSDAAPVGTSVGAG